MSKVTEALEAAEQIVSARDRIRAAELEIEERLRVAKAKFRKNPEDRKVRATYEAAVAEVRAERAKLREAKALLGTREGDANIIMRKPATPDATSK